MTLLALLPRLPVVIISRKLWTTDLNIIKDPLAGNDQPTVLALALAKDLDSSCHGTPAETGRGPHGHSLGKGLP